MAIPIRAKRWSSRLSKPSRNNMDGPNSRETERFSQSEDLRPDLYYQPSNSSPPEKIFYFDYFLFFSVFSQFDGPLQVIYKFFTLVWRFPSAIRCSMWRRKEGAT